MTMSAALADYRVRIATAGASAVAGNVDVTLSLADVAGVPTISGPSVSVLDGNVVSAPFIVSCITDAVLFTASGRFTALGRLVEIQRDFDGAGWSTIATGRLVHASEPERGMIDIEISDDLWTERNARIFETTDTAQLHPPGLTTAFMSRQPVGGTGLRTYTVKEVSGDAVHIVPDDEADAPDVLQVPSSLREALARDLIAAPDQESSATQSGGNFTNLRFDIDSGPYAGDHTVISFRPNFSGVFLGRTDKLGLLGTLAPDQSGNLQDAWVYISGHSLSATDQLTGRFYWPSGAPITENVPLHIGGAAGVHPMALLEDVLDGTYGGDAVGYDATAMTAAKALPLRPVWVRPTAPVNRSEFLRGLYGMYGVLPLVGTDLKIYPTQIRLPQNVNPGTLTTLDATNARGLTWNHGSRDFLTQLEVKAQSVVELDETTDRGRDWPLDGFEGREITHGLQSYDNTATLGEVVHTVETSLILEPWPRSYSDSVVAELARGLFEPLGDGAVFGEITTADTLGLQVGDLVIIDCASLEMFNQGDAARTGERIVRLLTFREYTPASITWEFLDLGENAAVLSAPGVSVAQNGTDADLIDVTISSLGAGELAHVELAVGTSTPSIYPYVREGVGNETVQFRVPASNQTAYARALTTVAGRIRSAFATDTATLSTRPIFDAAAVRISKYVGVVTWTPDSATLGVRARWSVHARGEIPSFGSTTDYDAADGAFTISPLGFNEVLTVELVPYTGYSSGTVSGTSGDAVYVTANHPSFGTGWVEAERSASGLTKTLHVDSMAFRPVDSSLTDIQWQGAYVSPTSTTARSLVAPLEIPVGATISRVRFRVFRSDDSADTFSGYLYETTTLLTAAVNLIGSVTLSVGSGLGIHEWATIGSLTKLVIPNRSLYLQVSIGNGSAGNDCRFGFAEIDYTVPSLDKSL